MTGSTGWTLRQFGHVSVLFGMLVGATAQTIPASEAARTCFGQAATVADHSGTIDARRVTT